MSLSGLVIIPVSTKVSQLNNLTSNSNYLIYESGVSSGARNE